MYKPERALTPIWVWNLFELVEMRYKPERALTLLNALFLISTGIEKVPGARPLVLNWKKVPDPRYYRFSNYLDGLGEMEYEIASEDLDNED